MKKSIKVKFALVGLFFCSTIFAQTDKTVLAFSKSIGQEKKLEYSAAIETIIGLKDTTSYENNMRLGWLCYKAGYKKASLAYYQKAINLNPKAIEPRYGYGFPAYQLEDFKELIEQDKKILEIDPNNKIINGNLGSIFYYSKDYKNAFKYLEKVVSLYPFDYDSNLLLAWTNLKLGKNEEAEKYFNIVLLFSPKDVSANEGLSYIKRTIPLSEKTLAAFLKSYELAEKNDYKGAISAIKEVYDASSYFMNLRLGWLYYLAAMQPEAAGYYKIASDIQPNAVEPKLGCGFPAEVLGNKNELKTQYDLILTIDPQNTLVHYKMGVLDYGKKEYQTALTHFEKIVTLYPCDTDGLLMLAWTNYQLGKTAESKALFNKVLCLSPNNASALQGLTIKPVEQTKKSSGF